MELSESLRSVTRGRCASAGHEVGWAGLMRSRPAYQCRGPVSPFPIPARCDHGCGALVAALRAVLQGRRGSCWPNETSRSITSRSTVGCSGSCHCSSTRPGPAGTPRGDRWFIDDTYGKVSGRWVYLFRAIDQNGQVSDVLVSQKRDLVATRRFFIRALNTTTVIPVEVITDKAVVYPQALDELSPAPGTTPSPMPTTGIEADHGRLKSRLRPMRGLTQRRSARGIITGHAFIQNLRRGHHELGTEEPTTLPVVAALTKLTRTIGRPPKRIQAATATHKATAPFFTSLLAGGRRGTVCHMGTHDRPIPKPDPTTDGQLPPGKLPPPPPDPGKHSKPDSPEPNPGT
jgi:IS6 family transposase